MKKRKYHKLIDTNGRLVSIPVTALLHMHCEVCKFQAYVARAFVTRDLVCPHCLAKAIHWSSGLDGALVLPMLPREPVPSRFPDPNPASSPSALTSYSYINPEDVISERPEEPEDQESGELFEEPETLVLKP